MLPIVKDLLVCDLKGRAVTQRLAGTKVTGVARVCAAGDDYTQAVP